MVNGVPGRPVLALEDVRERVRPALQLRQRHVKRIPESRQVARDERDVPPPVLVGRRL